MRNPIVILKQMLDVIPKDQKDLIKRLKWNINDCSYRPPEDTIGWDLIQETLIDYLEFPKEEWEYKVISIFTTKPIEELK